MDQLYFIFCFISLASGLSVTQRKYEARISPSTHEGDIVGLIVGLPEGASGQIQYALDETNEWIRLDKNSGEVILKRDSPPDTLNLSLDMTASDIITGDTASASLKVSTVTQFEKCQCFTFPDDLEFRLAENHSPNNGIIFLSPPSCSNRYTLDGNGVFNVKNSRLMMSALDYETRKSVSTEIRCRDETRYVTVSVLNLDDNIPHIPTQDGSSKWLIEYDLDVEPDQIKSKLGKRLDASPAFRDPDGIANNFTLHKLNDHTNQIKVGRLIRLKTFYSFTVSWAPSLVIQESVTIDVVAEDQSYINGDSGVKPNITWRFHLNYIQVDELSSLNLKSEYHLNVSTRSQLYSQVYRFEHNASRSLVFSLQPKEGTSVCKQFVNTTLYQGILFVSDTEAMSQCMDYNQVQYTLTVSQGDQHEQSTVKIIMLPTESAILIAEPVTCAQHSNSTSCSGAIGLGSTGCMWKTVSTSSSNFSTCVPNPSCGDGKCSELELYSPEQICPQDCSVRWTGTSQKTCGSQPGICRAHGVCFWKQPGTRYLCIKPEHINTMIDDDDYYYDPGYSGDEDESSFHLAPSAKDDIIGECGITCIVSALLVSIFLFLLAALVPIYIRHKRGTSSKGSDASAWRVSGNSLSVSLNSLPDYGGTPTTHVSLLSDLGAFPSCHNMGHLELYDEKWELSRQNILIESYIGEGEFGKVMKANVRKSDDQPWMTAAVKMLKDGATRNEYMDLASEYNLLKEADHPNVIRIVGAATVNGPLQLVVEYCEHGSLKSYLRRIRTEEPLYINGYTEFYTQYATELLAFSWQISKGMEYLSDIKLAHRDLAARNILITSGKVVKISDFGMTKDIYEEEAYKKKGQGRIPVKWMAPESLYHQIYTTKSDVWSFGIVLWEIATLGATPYPGIPPERMYHLLQDGYRMDMPETCSQVLYSIMRKCWQHEPANRPSFRDLRRSLEQLMEDEANYLDLSVAQSHKMSPDDDGSDERKQLTVALLPQSESKFVEDYLVARDSSKYDHPSKLRYLAVDIDDET